VIRFLYSQSPDAIANRLRAFRQGLKEIGYIEGENVAIVYRWAENDIDRLPELAAELVRRPVALIVCGNDASALAGKATTTLIPIVFGVAADPVKLGLVTSLARPDGNLTGFGFLNVALNAKRLEVLRELVPHTARLGVLINPMEMQPSLADLQTAAVATGLHLHVLNASTIREIDAAVHEAVRERLDALFVTNSGFFTSRRVQLAIAAARHSIPAVYGTREFIEVGGLISYASNLSDIYRQIGVYAGRILKGAKPADLPVVQPSRLELVINAQTARTLGIEVPPALLARADEVIE
jgi:putative ABC transport system substrate-binding protein